MRKAPLTGLTTGTFDEVLVRNPPFSGSLVSVTSLGGGGGSSYDDTEVRSLISQNLDFSILFPSISRTP